MIWVVKFLTWPVTDKLLSSKHPHLPKDIQSYNGAEDRYSRGWHHCYKPGWHGETEEYVTRPGTVREDITDRYYTRGYSVY